MFIDFIKIAIRGLRRNPISSMVNLIGLSLGLSVCLTSSLYIKNEITSDHFHTKIDSIYRITSSYKTITFSSTPYPLVESLTNDLPEVNSGLRATDRNTIISIADEKFLSDVVFADPNYFQFFDFSFREGNPELALNYVSDIVISEKIADRYFGSSAIGQVIRIKLGEEFHDFQVSGVLNKIPANSSIDFDLMIPLENAFADGAEEKSWSSYYLTSFVIVAPDKIEQLEEKIPDLLTKYLADREGENPADYGFIFNPFIEHNLSGGSSGPGLKSGKGTDNLWIFGSISVVILLLACFNFMNLSIARASGRLKEIGIRKVIGANRTNLIWQFFGEAYFFTGIAALAGIGLAELNLIIFMDLLQTDMSTFSGGQEIIISGYLIIIIITGLLAGLYPAMVMSNLKPVFAFRKSFQFSGNNITAKSLITVQFFLSITLIICAIVMYRQDRFLLNKDLGYNKDNLVITPFQEQDTVFVDILKQQLLNSPGILSVAKTDGSFTRGNHANFVKLPDGSRMLVFEQKVDADYIPLMEIDIIRGRNFRKEDQQNNIIVNESYLKHFPIGDSMGIPLQRRISNLENPTIIGITEDFNHQALRSSVEPLVFIHSEGKQFEYLISRIDPEKTEETIANMINLFKETNSNALFEYFLLEDDLENQYASDWIWIKIISILTFMAIFLSSLGLFAMSLYATEKRRKEIGIRKVLGASIFQLMGLLSRNFGLLVAVAFILASPVSYLVMQKYWLQSYAYKVPVGIETFLGAFVLIILVIVIAIGGQTFKASLANPVDELKEE